MNPPPMPTLLELLTPLAPPPPRVTYVRTTLCATCKIEPRAVMKNGKLDAYCTQCKKIMNKKHYKKRVY